MVARLLYLEESEKQRGYEINDNLKYSNVRNPRESNVDSGPVGFSGRNHEVLSEGRGSESLIPIPIPQPELKAFPNKMKSDSVLPVSKWARDDDESDDEHKRSTKDLALGYSSSGSENTGGGGGGGNAEVAEPLSNANIFSDSGLSEEKRLLL